MRLMLSEDVRGSIVNPSMDITYITRDELPIASDYPTDPPPPEPCDYIPGYGCDDGNYEPDEPSEFEQMVFGGWGWSVNGDLIYAQLFFHDDYTCEFLDETS